MNAIQLTNKLQLINIRAWLTVFTSEELNSVTELARHAAVQYTYTCRHPGVRPQTSSPCSHLPVVMALRRVLGELRQCRTEHHRRPITDDYLFSVPYRWLVSFPELQLYIHSTRHRKTRKTAHILTIQRSTGLTRCSLSATYQKRIGCSS